MAVPARKTSKAMDAPTLVKCPNCGGYAVSHKVCGNCGYYNGKEVISKEA